MPSASRTKAADRQNICRKLVPALKKHYGGKVPEPDLPVMESLLLSVCLEETPFDQGNASYARLLDSFHDLNEIRVSSLTELIRIFPDDPLAELRAMRIRNILQFVFEESFSFDLEDLQRKTLDQASRQLARIPELSPFVRLSVLQHPLGNHLIPVDEAARRALIWLGLADIDDSAEEAAGLLKSAIRKADGRLFCFLLHSLATDPRYVDHFSEAIEQADSEGNGEAPHTIDPSTAASRLADLLAGRSKPAKKKAPAKSTTTGKKAAAARKKAPVAAKKKSAAPKASKKSSSSTTAGKKAAAGKKTSTSKASAGKKSAGKKSAGKKSSATRKTTGKKAAGKKATARKKATGTSRTKASAGRSKKSSTGSGRSRSR